MSNPECKIESCQLRRSREDNDYCLFENSIQTIAASDLHAKLDTFKAINQSIYDRYRRAFESGKCLKDFNLK